MKVFFCVFEGKKRHIPLTTRSLLNKKKMIEKLKKKNEYKNKKLSYKYYYCFVTFMFIS